MANWWNAMGLFEQILAGLGVVSVMMLVIQTVMALLGAIGGGAADIDADVGDLTGDTSADLTGTAGSGDISGAEAAGGLTIFTVQGVVSFFAIFSWTGLLLIKSGLNLAIGLIFAAVLGYLAMFGMAAIMRAMVKLQYDGTTDIRNAMGGVGTVYLTIPSRRGHTGKVTILIQGRLTEMDAVTDDEESIPTGAQVLVTGVSGKNTLLVKRK